MGATPNLLNPQTQTNTVAPFYTPPPPPTAGGGGPFGYMTLAGEGETIKNLGYEENDYAKYLSSLLGPSLSGYQNYLNQVTSADPTQRFAAVAPAAQGVSQQQETARKNISSALPRGGAQDYLTGISYIQESSDIGKLIENAYNQAQQQKGELGEFGVRASQAGESLSQSALSSGANVVGQALNLKYGQKAEHQKEANTAIETLGYLLMLCKVAEALWGEKSPRTWIIRIWMYFCVRETKLGKVLVGLYLMYGERMAQVVRRSPRVRRCANFLFTRMLNRAVSEMQGRRLELDENQRLYLRKVGSV